MDKEKTLRKLKQEIEEVREKFGIEFAEIVRCKDCKHYIRAMSLCTQEAGMGDVRDKMDFCSCGERWDNNESLRIST